ncbi:MAG: hypothetical protein EA386_07000, partial [Rhodobacteraceae bacterium]
MQTESARLGLSLAAIIGLLSVIGITLGGIGAPWWGWCLYLVWAAPWITAALGLSDGASRKFLAGGLRRSTYTQIYTTLTRRLLTPLWTRLCDPAPDKAPWPTQFRAALTWRLYDRALLIAVAYPILLLVGQWVVTGNEGRVGSFVVLPEATFWPERAVVMLILLIVAAGFVGRKLAIASQRPTAMEIAGWLPFLPVLVAVALLLLLLIAGVGVGTFEVAGAVALSFAITGAVVGAGAGAV